MKESKHPGSSRTVWLGALTVMLAALTDPSVVAIIPVEWAPKLLALVGVLNIVLRAFTNKPLGIKKE